MNHKAGFINIIGNPNVGKSTLMNALLGENLSIITPKAQTTRHRILGILNKPNHQIIFSDTPGIIRPHYLLQKAMMNSMKDVLEDGDLFLYVVHKLEGFEDERMLEKFQNAKVPLIILVNKMDEIQPSDLEAIVEHWHSLFPKAAILPISALKKVNLELLLTKLLDLLPENPPFYPKDELTDRPERFFVNEIIRESALFLYKKEIPYSIEVVTESFKEEKNLIEMHSIIYVERNSQKGILIGHQGEALSKLGKKSREKLEEFFNKKVYLQLRIKVKKNWRSDSSELKKLGYIS